MTDSDEAALLPIASITRAQGLNGAFRVRLEFDDDRLFEVGRPVVLTLGKDRMEAEIEMVRHQHGRWVMQVSSIRSINEVESWIGARIEVPKTDLPAVEDGAYYSFELEGCTVYSGGQPVGSVKRLLDYGTTSLLELDRNGTEVLIPFAKAYLRNVDTAAKRIDVDLPDGLVELNERSDRSE